MTAVPPNFSSSPSNEEVVNQFRRVLNRHGFPFQEAVLRAVGSIETGSGWEAWMPEFPVSVQDQSTRIDVILASPAKDRFIVCECKRANPSIANWCFAQSQLRFPGSSLANRAYAETLLDRGDGVVGMHVRELQSASIYHIGVEASTHKKGDEDGAKKGQEIEDACGQVCRGLNGLIECFYQRNMLKTFGRREALFLPMIVTTANLYATTNDLSLASIESGELGETPLRVEKVNWLWYRYHQSPALKHQVPLNNPSMAFNDILFYEFARTIAIVSPNGISEFLSHRMWLTR